MCTLIRYLVLWVLFFLNCLVGRLSMIIRTPAILSVLYAYVLYLHLFSATKHVHMERRCRNMLIIIIIITIGFH